MTNQQILQRAIEKAGLDCGSNIHGGRDSCVDFFVNDVEAPDVYTIIFSHEFAKAFWGDEEWVCYTDGGWRQCDESMLMSSRTPFVFPVWQYHLQQMVLEEEPLKYLEKFL